MLCQLVNNILSPVNEKQKVFVDNYRL